MNKIILYMTLCRITFCSITLCKLYINPWFCRIQDPGALNCRNRNEEFNNLEPMVMMWKIVEASKVSVLYIYIYIYIDDKIYLEVTLLLC